MEFLRFSQVARLLSSSILVTDMAQAPLPAPWLIKERRPGSVPYMARRLFSLLFLLLLLFSPAIAQDFWNIACGGNEPFTSPLNDLTFEGDGAYVGTGVRGVIQDPVTLVPDPELRTVRSFPANRKNCYNIPVEEGVKVLVRVWFNYGNYDGKGDPPRFQVFLDGNEWCFMTTARYGPNWCESLYMTRKNGTDICLGMVDGGGVPFVNAIQVRRLKPTMYAGPDYTNNLLFYQRRFAFGTNATSNPVVRYPFDRYDRRWFAVDRDGYRFLQNNATTINTSRASDEPPGAIFGAAMGPLGAATNLTIGTAYLSTTRVQIYVALYFTEITNLTGTGDVRSFNLFLDGKSVYDRPITPSFGEVLEVSGVVSATNNTRFDMVPTNVSTLPPVVSAMEVYQLVAGLNNGTNKIDVDALSLIQRKFEVLQDWTGDPCLPTSYNWEWVKCNTDASPRVTKLFLSGYGLLGDLPDFSAMEELLTIDLHNNKLSGSIPEFLSKLSNLDVLNLADNDFSSIPTWLSNNTKILVNVTGNPKLCTLGQFCFIGNLSDEPSLQPSEASTPPPPSRGNKFMAPLVWVHILILVLLGM